MTLDASGNLSVAATSPVFGSTNRGNITVGGSASSLLFLGTGTTTGTYISHTQSTATAEIWNTANGPMLFATNNTERARITSGGNLLVGTTSSPSQQAAIYRTSATTSNGALLLDGNGDYAGVQFASSGTLQGSIGIDSAAMYFTHGSVLSFKTGATSNVGGTERARITSGGDLLVGTTSQPVSGITTRLAVVQSTGDYSQVINNTNASPYGLYIKHNTDSNGAGNPFIVAIGNATTRFAVRSDGGIENYSANNVNLSDRREKTNFAPAKPYLDTICAIPVQTFNYIDQSEDDPGLTLGVVAQDVQAVAPELVMESNWGTAEEPKMRLSIYQTDLQYALMKCVQELKAQNDDLRARVAALEA
jgi:hypothetical protein